MKSPSKVGMKCGSILFGRMNIGAEFSDRGICV